MAEETTPVPSGGSKDTEQNKAIAAIGYIGILFLIPLLAAKNSPFAQYHAKQGLVLFIFSIIVSAVSVIPFLGWAVGSIGGILTLILLIMGIVNALGGQMKPLPIIGSYAEKFKF